VPARKPIKQATILAEVNSPTGKVGMITGFTGHFSPLGQHCADFTKSWPAPTLPYDIYAKNTVGENCSGS